MADHRGPESAQPPAAAERSHPATDALAIDLAAALSDLDRATRSFAERLGARPAVDTGPLPAPADAGPPPPGEAGREAAFEARMRDAEREAAEYLAHAKRRADSLVNAMVGAVEREAAEMRREAEVGIRARWQAVEADATRQVEEARGVAERMVADRQRRIAELSDGITGKARALTAGMEDAERIRRQFEEFVRALSEAADRIAAGIEPAAPAAGERDEGALAKAIAA